MMTIKTSLALAAAGFFAATSLAQAETARPYISFGAGLSFLEDSEISGSGARANLDYSTGWAVSGAFGMGLFNNFRAEVELAHRDNSVDNFPGEVRANSLMANFLYDIPITLGVFTPYIGVGVGGARVKAEDVVLGGALGTVDDNDNTWAYQGIVGMSAPFNDSLAITVDYRYFSTFQDLEFSNTAGARREADYADHTLMVGLRWSFGGAPAAPAPVAQPAAAPAPAPAPQPAAVSPMVRSFQVFFDFDRSDITEDARKIINQAAGNARRAGGTTRITLTGHADRSGAAQYNMRLSQRRADAVKAELIKLGLTANDIATVAKGESDPLVPTADGVREPRNRRVEIVF